MGSAGAVLLSQRSGLHYIRPRAGRLVRHLADRYVVQQEGNVILFDIECIYGFAKSSSPILCACVSVVAISCYNHEDRYRRAEHRP